MMCDCEAILAEGSTLCTAAIGGQFVGNAKYQVFLITSDEVASRARSGQSSGQLLTESLDDRCRISNPCFAYDVHQ
jgi:hypothetical protein